MTLSTNWSSSIRLACLPLFLSVGMLHAQCPVTSALSGTFTPFGDATGTGPYGLTTTGPNGYSGVDLAVNQTLTFAELTSLSANFSSLTGGANSGAPRFTIGLNVGGTETYLNIVLGTSPSYNDSNASLDTYSGFNVIGNNDAGRYDTSHFAGGSPFTTYTSALALVGSYQVEDIFYVIDGIGQNETLNSFGGLFSLPCYSGGGTQQVHYFNDPIGDQYIDLTNTGASGAGLTAGTTATVTGAICVNAYAFAADEEMVACCSCPVTPNGADELSVNHDLLGNVLEPQLNNVGISVVLTATAPVAGSCSGSAFATLTTTSLAPALAAWAIVQHANTSLTPAFYQETETEFENKALSAAEGTRLTTLCMFINANGSGPGICNSCTPGALAASKK